MTNNKIFILQVTAKLSADTIHYSSLTIYCSSTLPISYYSWTVLKDKFFKNCTGQSGCLSANADLLSLHDKCRQFKHHYASIIELFLALYKANNSQGQGITITKIEKHITNSELGILLEFSKPSTKLSSLYLYKSCTSFIILQFYICKFITITNYL